MISGLLGGSVASWAWLIVAATIASLAATIAIARLLRR